MNLKLATILTVAAMMLVSAGQSARAQVGKALGHDYNFWETMGWQHHAQNQARSLYVYSQTPQPVAAPATEHVTAARASVVSAKKNLAELKKVQPDNKEAQASIAKIEEIQKTLLAHCDKADKAIAGGKHDEIAATSADMYHDLDEANAEMAKLQKALKIEKPAPPKKK
jgi:hypothetical protein